MSTNQAITQEDIEKLLSGITVPSPPQLIADLQMEMSLPDPDLNDLADMINKDVGLAGGIIKIVNSPFYGKKDVISISKAVMLLGMKTVMNIVNTLYIRDSMINDSDRDDEKYKSMIKFWDSTTDVAQTCQIIAKYVNNNNNNDNLAYLLGLFHNAGIPLLMQKFPNYPEIICQSYAQSERRVVDIENDEYNTNHSVLSFYTARSWRLPNNVCRIISEHHNGVAIFNNKSKLPADDKTLLAILIMGQHITGLYRILGNQDFDGEWQQVGELVTDYLGLTEDNYDDLVEIADELGINNKAYIM